MQEPAHNLSPEDRARLAECDRRYVWHPFTQHALWNTLDPLIITAAEGEYVIDAEGRRYLDGHSSLWCNLHGHRRPEIDRAIIEQLGRVAHSTQLGLASPPAITLAKRLVDLAPPGLCKVFFSDDGSTSVEVACKMAFAYWQHAEQPQRRRFIALRNAYHGDTVGAVSVGGIDLFHRVYQPLLFETHFAASPYCYRCPIRRNRELAPSANRGDPTTRVAWPSDSPLSRRHAAPAGACGRPDESGLDLATPTPQAQPPCHMECLDSLRELLERYRGEVAALVIEPLVQCAGGIITAPRGYLAAVRQLCDEHDVLLIADEVATGFGRTGRMFACEHEGVAPDLHCLSKGLTGGYLPLAATLATQRIYDAFLGPIDSGRTFYHGHTFTGNPLACAAALASLDCFETDRTLERLPAKIERLATGLSQLASRPHIGDIRQCGLIAGIELVRDKATREAYPYTLQVGAKVCARARHYGVILRPLADTIVIMPPLIISLENLDHLVNTVDRCLADVMPEINGPVDGLE